MIKSEIIEKVKDLFVYANNKEYWLITGAAMVMYGIKTQTLDIDVGCTKEFFQDLQKKGYSVIKKDGYPDRIQIDTYVEVLEGLEVTKIEYIEGIPVSAIADIIEFKKKLNREKDKEDLLRIENYMQHINMRKQRLYNILKYCKKNILYYKEYLKDIKCNDDIKTILSELPIVNKQEYIECFNQYMYKVLNEHSKESLELYQKRMNNLKIIMGIENINDNKWCQKVSYMDMNNDIDKEILKKKIPLPSISEVIMK